MSNTSSKPQNKLRVGFIGLGNMGRFMAGHILAAGHSLSVYNRSRDKADELLARGASWCATPGEVAANADVIITMVGYPRDVEQVYLGTDGIVARANKALLIDMTTSSPELAVRVAERRQKGCRSLDARSPVAISTQRQAHHGRRHAGRLRQALPVLQRMGANIVLQGGPGAGQHTKMCNQIVIASTIMGVSEGLAYAKSAGLDLPTVLKSIGGGAASGFQLTVMGGKMIAGDFAPGFYIEHFIKDLGIALAEAERMKLELPGLALARKLFVGLADQGMARLGTQSLIKHYGV
jgi:3-hydroxyisobutyrate dehydrogenase